VRDRNVYIMHPLVMRGQPAKHVMIARQISDNLKRSDSEDVILFDLYNPYFSYDKRKGKQPISVRLVLDSYKTAGVGRTFTVEPHSDLDVIASAADSPLEPLGMQIPLSSYFRERHELDRVTVCSPDIGGYNRAEVFADLLQVPLVALRKKRSEERSDTTTVLSVVGDRKDIEGRTIVFRDDVVRTAGSIVGAKEALRAAGAVDFYVVAPHLSLDGHARQIIRENGLKVIGTNTIPQSFSGDEAALYDVMDISPIVAEVVYRRSEGLSIGEFFQTFRRNGHV
jgi:ribose-phosphate pyrophosphokinase